MGQLLQYLDLCFCTSQLLNPSFIQEGKVCLNSMTVYALSQYFVEISMLLEACDQVVCLKYTVLSEIVSFENVCTHSCILYVL